MVVINVLRTSMGVRFEIPIRAIEAAVLRWAEENLHAPKMGREQGRTVMEKGDGYYAHIASLHYIHFHRAYFSRVCSIIAQTGIQYGLDVKIQEHVYERRAPYRCVFDNYGFAMNVDDPESRFFYQNEVVERATDPETEQIVFAIQTGRGKTKSAQKVMVKKGVRTVLIHRPTYKDKWVFDCVEDETGLRIQPHEIRIAQGTQGIYDVIQDGRDGVLDEQGIKVVIIPTVSLSNFLKEYYNTASASMITPETFYDDLRAGAVVYDEVHEHFYLVYMSAVLLNPPFLLDMSATLKPGKSKKFIADRYLERFPMPTRVSVPYMPVVDCRGIYYSIEDRQLANRIQRVNPYNHKLVEQLMFKHHLMESFFEMVWDMIQKSYLKNHQKGQKALVFFALVESCQMFKQFLDKKLKDAGWDLVTAKYNAGDSYDEFIAADIGISTPGKAGTAIDIPGLVQVYVTIPIDDQQLNEQVAGRPRVDFKWGLTPKVWFLHALEVPKHMAYLQSRQTSLAGVVKSFMTAFSPYVIRKRFHATNPYANDASSSVSKSRPGKVSGKRTKRIPRRRGRRR